MKIVCSVLLILALVAVCVFGCAFTKSTLNVQYTADNAQKGPLSTIEPLSIELGDFTDKRKDTVRIGFKRSGYGQQTADIVSARSVSEVVKDAHAAELAANGHVFNRDPKNVVLTGAFWFDY